jgi:sec-independent protein translocase protein TatA
MFGGLGMPELIIILVIILIIFGAGKLPQIGEGMGKAIRNFKKATSEKDDTEPKKIDEDKKP